MHIKITLTKQYPTKHREEKRPLVSKMTNLKMEHHKQ